MPRDSGNPFKTQVALFAPAALVAFLGFLLAYQFVDPAPPDSLRIATAKPEGAYHLFAKQYAARLAKERVTLIPRNSAGSVENIRLLLQRDVDIAFVQGGVAPADLSEQLASIGSLYYEPIWVFHDKRVRLERLTDLRGMRIAVGAEGSGTRALAVQLLRDNEVTAANASLVAESGTGAAESLLEGRVEAAFFVASHRSPVVRSLLDTGNIELMSFSRASAYTRVHRFLSAVTLPQGVIDLEKNLPGKETTLLAASANLVIHRDLHPALIDLVLQAARTIHGNGGWFEEPGEFPSPEHLDLPLAPEAERFYEYGPPVLQRYLPFWAATLVDRMKVMLLPLIALLLPLFKIMPPLYRWRMRARIYRWYRDVLAIDRSRREDGMDARSAEEGLLKIESEVRKVSVPLSFADELYDLQLHIALVRDRLNRADRTE